MSMPTPTPTPTPYQFGSYVAQCASGGVAGNVYSDPNGIYQDYDSDTPNSSCNNCVPQNQGQIQTGYGGISQTPSATCNNTAPIPWPTTNYTGQGWNQGGGPVQTVQNYRYSANNNQNMSDWNFAGLSGNTSHGLNHTQIVLIILLVLLVCGTGAFLLFRNLKK